MLDTQTVRFGRGNDRVRVVDAEGNPLAVDKGGRLQRDFSNTEDSARDEIMDALEQVMHDLTEKCGLQTYLMYGCLLGAVRNGHMIGHDSDADVAYLSAYTHPFDIIRECTTAIRTMKSLGWKVVKMSGANFKVWVPLPDGRRCGIDVFGSFHIGDSFYVTGSLTGTLDRSALLPFGTVTLEGREITAPAKPEEVLAFTYGPDWRVPDPAFHFDHDPMDVARMDAWFRAPRRRLRFWHDFYKSPDAARVPTEPSAFALWAQERMAAAGHAEGHVLDVGAGTGRDAAYFAARGHRVTALDFTTLGLKQTKALREQGPGPGARAVDEPRGPALGAGHRRPLRAPRRGPPGLRARPARHARPQRPGQPVALRLDGAAPRRRDLPGVPHPPLPPRAASTSACTSGRTSTRTPSRGRWPPTVAPSCTARPAATWPGSARRTRTSPASS